MKKSLAPALCACLALTVLAACGDDRKKPGSSTTAATTTAITTTVVTTTVPATTAPVTTTMSSSATTPTISGNSGTVTDMTDTPGSDVTLPDLTIDTDGSSADTNPQNPADSSDH